mmetsp:Transcript_26802/g.104091  ORF Transcript_26802/g.104091 Transcript_26802/m.104091 type:complete len:83 (-) Transcript_26802:1346-1594(-)
MENRRTLAVLGARGVGKSSVVERFCYNRFYDNYNPTIMVNAVVCYRAATTRTMNSAIAKSAISSNPTVRVSSSHSFNRQWSM